MTAAGSLPSEISWHDPFQPTTPSVDGFSDLIVALREVQESVTGSRPPADVVDAAAALLREVCVILRAYQVDEDIQVAGRLWTEAGRAQALAPAVHIDAVSETTLDGWVTFGRFHSGRGAVHGGALPLVLDEVMARLSNSHGRARSRTAYLPTDHRAVVPVGVRLDVRAWLVSESGRKRLLRSTLSRDGQVLAEGEGLWVALRPGQP